MIDDFPDDDPADVMHDGSLSNQCWDEEDPADDDDTPGACNCTCHDPGDTSIHVVPCCVPCALCGRRIALDFVDEHRHLCVSTMIRRKP